MKKKIILLLIFPLIFGIKASGAQEDMFKALFMYNFTKNIDWPTEYKEGDFIIGVLGNSPIISELNRLSKNKKAGNRRIVIKRFPSVKAITKCNIIYIPTSKSTQLKSVMTKLKGKATLIITDKPGLTKKGACINYVKVNGSQKFEISKQNIIGRKLKISSFLASLGILV